METTHRFRDRELPLEERVEALIGELSVEEKVTQLTHDTPPVDRLGIPAYNYWNEALHGIARAGVATVFPQAIGLAATFDPDFLEGVADVIAEEGRAKHHEFQRRGDCGSYKGLTFWSPNVNIFRDPRWGRGHETYGEDPYLTAALGVAFIRGLQGEDPRFLKAAACVKHYAVHSGPEEGRGNFDSVVSRKDLFETYLPAFEACVRRGGAEIVMGAYNAVNGTPCNANTYLLEDLLRGQWGFAGHVVSDCGAIDNLHNCFRTVPGPAEAAALAIRAGCDLNCGDTYLRLYDAWELDLIEEADLDRALRRVLRSRFRLGMFDDPADVPYSATPYERVACREHRALAREAARRSLVLLKNDGILPLDSRVRIAVIGPNADNKNALLGNYHGTPGESFTVLEGLRRHLGEDAPLLYAQGSEHYKPFSDAEPGDRLSEAVSAALRSDVALLCLGLDATMEGEAGDAYNSFAGGDRTTIDLPPVQQELMEKIAATGTPMIVLLLCGGAMDLRYADAHAAAVIQGFYPGEQGGRAVADLLYGAYAPSGRLPVTFYARSEDLPPYTDYAMRGRTYRYLQKEPLYPFGYGLSYTTFAYEAAEGDHALPIGDALTLPVRVTNTGGRDALEHVQAYVSADDPSVEAPIRQLRAVRTVAVPAGETVTVELTLDSGDFSLVDDEGKRFTEPGRYTVRVAGHQTDSRSIELTGQHPAVFHITLTGPAG